jgi:hypothetical protein
VSPEGLLTHEEVLTLLGDIATLKQRVLALEKGKDSQDSCLRDINNKLDSLNGWIRTLMGSMIVSLALLAINLLGGRITP